MRRLLNELILTPLLAEVRITDGHHECHAFHRRISCRNHHALSIRSARKRPFRTVLSSHDTLYFMQTA